MKMNRHHRVRRSDLRWIACLLTALIICTVNLSCDFIASDMFPKDLLYASGGYDLAEELGVDPDTIKDIRIERLRSLEGVHGIFVTAFQPGGWRLWIFDEQMKLIQRLSDPYFSRFLGSYSNTFSPDRSFICGRTDIGSAFQVTSSNTELGCNEWLFDIATSYLVLSSTTIDTGSETYTQVNLYDKQSGNLYANARFAPSGQYYLLDTSLLFAAGSSPHIYLLAKPGTFGSTEVLWVGFPYTGETDLTTWFSALSSSLIESPGSKSTAINLTDIDQGWVTEDGIVVLTHGGDSRLRRFNLQSGAELDSIRIDSDWMQALSFDDEGDYWFYYDPRTGYVKRMRTWW